MPLHPLLVVTDRGRPNRKSRSEPKQRGRAGTEKFTPAECQSADHHFGDATGIRALALMFPALYILTFESRLLL